MSDFTMGVVNVWGGERLGDERLTITTDIILNSSYINLVDTMDPID